MGVVQSVKSFFGFGKANQKVDPKHNPYKENILLTVTVDTPEGEKALTIREIRNKQAQVMGAQAVLEYRNEKIPVVISSPHAENFSCGVNIGMHKSIMDDFKAELKRLQDEGLASPAAKLSYNPDTRTAILFRRSNSMPGGNIQRWKDICKGSMQPLVDDFLAVLPFVMNIYGE